MSMKTIRKFHDQVHVYATLNHTQCVTHKLLYRASTAHWTTTSVRTAAITKLCSGHDYGCTASIITVKIVHTITTLIQKAIQLIIAYNVIIHYYRVQHVRNVSRRRVSSGSCKIDKNSTCIKLNSNYQKLLNTIKKVIDEIKYLINTLYYSRTT